MSVYVVTETLNKGSEPSTSCKRLVEAKNKSDAIKHVVKTSIHCEIADASTIISMTKDGIELEKASNGNDE